METTKSRWKSYRNRCRRIGRDFNLSLGQFSMIVAQECTYCGTKGTMGIDRIDSNIGYNVENCVPCCWRCNTMKNNMPVEEFIERCRRITAVSFAGSWDGMGLPKF